MRPLIRRIVRSLLLSALFSLGALLLIAWWPSRSAAFTAPNAPAPDYESARTLAAVRLSNPPADVRPEGRSRILDHGHRTRDVYVLLHGLTNCPAQFRLLAAQLHDRGANVLVFRLPHHGLSDRLSDEPALLRAQDMLDTAAAAIDLAHGYGERVIVLGLSINGVTAAWLAQERADIALSVIIAPFFAPAGLPDAAIRPLANLLQRFPNSFVWWDAKQKESLAGSPFSYPRFATRSIGETMALGLDVFARAKTSPPRARKILFVTSPADTAISLSRMQELAILWKGHAVSRSFPADWKVPHDCIDPDQPGGDIARVYPQLLAWMDAEMN